MGNFGSLGTDNLDHHKAKNSKPKNLDFWLKKEDSTDVIFLSPVPLTFYIHSFKIAGKWNAASIGCTSPNIDGSVPEGAESCKFCAMLKDPAHPFGAKKKSHSRTFVGMYSVIDLRPWVNKDGEPIMNKHTNKQIVAAKKIFAAKYTTLNSFKVFAKSFADQFDAVKGAKDTDPKPHKFAGRINGDVSCAKFTVNRTDADYAPAVGNVFVPIGFSKIFEEFKDHFPENGIPAEDDKPARTQEELLNDFLTPHDFIALYDPNVKDRTKDMLSIIEGEVSHASAVNQYTPPKPPGW